MLRNLILLAIACLIYSCTETNSTPIPKDESSQETKAVKYAMVIHGGAGTITRAQMTPEKEEAYTKALSDALEIGQQVLSKGGSSMEAVTQTIISMENSPLFNAGKGAVFTNSGKNELDASLMRGSDMEAGAVGGITTIKNPILAAQAVLEKSEHVFMVGAGAETFAEKSGLETIDPSYFKTERRWNSLQRILEKEKEVGLEETELSESKFGTVGAVALDMNGDIVAGTSTGGMTNKRYNRIGDSPVIGAGTYANNKTCGVSCTGHGEYFIRYSVAHDVSAMMEYTGKSLQETAEHIVNKKLKEAGGSGGLIALDSKGNIVMPFNTAGMYRGYVTDSEKQIAIYKD